jgi:hypothetical protein
LLKLSLGEANFVWHRPSLFQTFQEFSGFIMKVNDLVIPVGLAGNGTQLRAGTLQDANDHGDISGFDPWVENLRPGHFEDLFGKGSLGIPFADRRASVIALQ